VRLCLPLLFALPLLLSGCNWVSLASNALTYETLQPGHAGNVVSTDSLAYVTLGDSGLAVVDVCTGARLVTVAPPAGMESVDDLALTGQTLFLLDARPPGHLVATSLTNPRHPRVTGSLRDVPVGPFSGVSANDSMVVVSGGTSRLTAWRYDSSGVASQPFASTDLGRGQPDVIVARGGLLFVSTHYWGPYFGVDVARLDGDSARLLGEVSIDGAGFTTGGAKPANFPMDAAQVDDSTFVVAYARGLARIVVSSAGTPRLADVADVCTNAVNVDVRGDTAAVACVGDQSSVVIAALTPRPRLLKRLALPPGTIPAGVALSSRNVIVAVRSAGVLTFRR